MPGFAIDFTIQPHKTASLCLPRLKEKSTVLLPTVLKMHFPVDCTINHDTYDDLKAKIQQKKRLHTVDIERWILYIPGRVLDKEQPFIPSPKDSRLPSKFLVEATNPESSDPEVDVVVMVGNQPAFLKRSVYEFFTSGTILCPSASSERFANSKRLPYPPPKALVR